MEHTLSLRVLREPSPGHVSVTEFTGCVSGSTADSRRLNHVAQALADVLIEQVARECARQQKPQE